MFNIFESFLRLLLLLLLLLFLRALFIEIVGACDAINELVSLNHLILDEITSSCLHELFRFKCLSGVSVHQLDFMPGAWSARLRLKNVHTVELLYKELIFLVTFENFIKATGTTLL